MRFVGICASLVVLATAAVSADLKIKILDPQSAVVAGARVELLDDERASVFAVGSSSPEGIVQFQVPDSHSYRVRVLAPGFATVTEQAKESGRELTIQLRPAPANE